jgi:hypothetical protein
MSAVAAAALIARMGTEKECAWQDSNLPGNQALPRPEDSTGDSTV